MKYTIEAEEGYTSSTTSRRDALDAWIAGSGVSNENGDPVFGGPGASKRERAAMAAFEARVSR